MIQAVINRSLQDGMVPLAPKEAVACTLLKRPSLDPIVLDNFNKISNLSFLEKLVEMVVGAKL